MKLEFFLAKRIIGSKAYKSNISSPIIKIGITAISLSIIVMLVSISTGLGLQSEIKNKISSFYGDIIISNFDSNNSEENLRSIKVNDSIISSIYEKENIKLVNRVANKFGIIRTLNDFDGVLFKGVDSLYEWDLISKYIIKGSTPIISSTPSDKVIISNKLSKRLDIDYKESFQMIFSNFNNSKTAIRKFEVIGIYDSGFSEIDENLIFGDIFHLQKINKWNLDEFGELEVFVENFEEIDTTLKDIYINTPSNLNSYSIKDKFASIFDWISIFDKNIFAIIFIMLIVSSINIISVLLIIILEKTNMIGILKSMGASNFQIKNIFLINVSYLISVGLLIGNILGLLLLYIQKTYKLIKLDPEIYYTSSVPVSIDIETVIMLNLFTFIICLLSVLIPSYIISKILPIKSIKFQ